MAGEENLKPMNKRTKAEQRRIAQMGGKASGEARRERKQLREYMNLLLDLPPDRVKDWNQLSKMGVPVEEIDNRMLLVAALFRKAVDKGDVQAVREIRSIIGEETSDGDGVIDKLLEGLKEGLKRDE